MSLDEAIEAAAVAIEGRVAAGSEIAVYKITASHDAIGDYLAENLNDRISMRGNLVPLARGAALQYVDTEHRGNAYYDKGDYDHAIADFTQGLRIDPNFAWMYYNNRGNAYRNKGDYDRAIADFEAALRVNPNLEEAKQDLEKARQARRR